MAKTGILLDSTTVLPPGYVDHPDVTLLRVPIYAGGKEYRDGINLTEEQFLQLLETLPERPTTAVPGVGEFVSLYERLLQKHRQVIYPVPSRRLSGLFNAAVQSAREVAGASVVVIDPDEGNHEGLLVLRSTSADLEEQLAGFSQLAAPTVVLMNTDFVSGAIALITIHALQAIAAGAPLDEIVRRMMAAKRGMDLYFILNKLDYVVDRVGQLQAFLGTLLHITPVLALQGGLVQDIAKTRGERKARQRMLELVQAKAGGRVIDAMVLHSQALEEAQELLVQLKSEVRVRNSWVGGIGCAVSRYTGRGGLGIAFTVV